jgi:hypothetical protein
MVPLAVHNQQLVGVRRQEQMAATKTKLKITPLEDRVVILPTDEAESKRGRGYRSTSRSATR